MSKGGARINKDWKFLGVTLKKPLLWWPKKKQKTKHLNKPTRYDYDEPVIGQSCHDTARHKRTMFPLRLLDGKVSVLGCKWKSSKLSYTVPHPSRSKNVCFQKMYTHKKNKHEGIHINVWDHSDISHEEFRIPVKRSCAGYSAKTTSARPCMKTRNGETVISNSKTVNLIFMIILLCAMISLWKLPWVDPHLIRAQDVK